MCNLDLDGEVRRLYEQADFDLCNPTSVISLAFRLLGQGSVQYVRGRGSMYDPATNRILIDKRLDVRARSYALAHELAEWHLLRLGYREADTEKVANALGARLIVPREAWRIAVASKGHDLETLAAWFRTTQAIMALRRGEVTDTPVALVTPRWIATRGEEYCWPPEPHLRLVAMGCCSAPVERVFLTDRPDSVLLIAA